MHDTMAKKEIIPVIYMYNKKQTTTNRYYYNIAKSKYFILCKLFFFDALKDLPC